MPIPPSPQNRTYLQSWLAMPARTRLYISMGACIVGFTGILVSDFLEKTLVPPEKRTATSQSSSTPSEFS
ncbi:hypothetical protein HYPSUDRAFT_128897 [Hypholoma sublateritium FD-334 SS-4]|uniref:Uncharacterized protein n=1 Tax=Hypholoma sublateritium (strain FD-334 SS-4) TaxID=945553 RepID=A0A0D2Q9T4_HYPSF|nr:hypothetical protein HYPSUDRAFT_128897 [Hypholoma sublateritium FD-334 SS-4]